MDISDTYNIKREAINCHKSQRSAPENPEFDKQVIERATAAARGQSYQYGEAFFRLEVLQRL
jgi:LmbE family N-acetylglucosaminyl deacetylase